MIEGNEFAAPSTASFGGSNEGSAEEATGRVQTFTPVVVARDGAGSDTQSNRSQSMADAIGNATASAGSTPLSYDMVTMSPVKDAPADQWMTAEVTPLPDLQDWKLVLHTDQTSEAEIGGAFAGGKTAHGRRTLGCPSWPA